MRIAIVTDVIYPFTLGGSEIRNHEIAKRLVKMGHEVHIYGAKFWKGPEIKVIDGVIIHGISNYERLYKIDGRRSIFDPFNLSIKLFFALMKEDFDIIENVSFVFFNCYVTKLVSLIKNESLIFLWQQYFGDYLLGYFGKIKGCAGMVLERLSTDLTKNNIAVSNHVKRELINKGIKKENIKVIYNGVDFRAARVAKSFERKYDLIFIGRLNYQKNIPLLIDSIRIIKKCLPKIKVCIIGEGNEKDKLVSMINSYGLEKNFDFIGRVENKNKIFKYLKSSKIFVLPSLLEGFPLTIVEANACGLPVISTLTKWNNTREYIKNYKNGFLAKLDAEDFSAKILKLLDDKKLLNKISKNSIEVAKNYDWDILAGQTENFYRSILDGN